MTSLIQTVAALLLAILLHEYGHITAALLFGSHVKRLGFCWRGAYVITARPETAALAVFCIAAGPLANFVGYFLPIALPDWTMANLILGITNLIPFGSSDGAQIVRIFRTASRTSRRLAMIASGSL